MCFDGKILFGLGIFEKFYEKKIMKNFNALAEEVKSRELTAEEVSYIIQKIKELTITNDKDLPHWIYLLGFVKEYQGFEDVSSDKWDGMIEKTIEDFRLLAAYSPDLESIWLEAADDEVLSYLHLFPKLLRFHIDEAYDARKKGIKNLWHLSQLTHLSINHFLDINDTFFKKLPLLEQLIDLELIWCRDVFNHHLKKIARLKYLRSLNLKTSLHITNDGMPYIATMKNLVCLGLGSTQISDHGIFVLSTLPVLKKLLLCYCPITDDGVSHLSLFQNLETVDLSFCNITDKGLQHLCKVEKLKIVNLTHCEQITEPAIKELPPQIQVIRYKPFSDDFLPDLSKLKHN